MKAQKTVFPRPFQLDKITSPYGCLLSIALSYSILYNLPDI